MIVRSRPSGLALLYTLRGSIVPQIASRVAAVTAASAVVTAAYAAFPGRLPDLPATPFTLLGLGLSIFLGFRNNACYDRWWEGRKQWGMLVTQARSFARALAALPGATQPVSTRATRRIIGFTHALAARLRNRDPVAAAAPWLPHDEAAWLGARPNPPDAILRALTADLAAARAEGMLSDISFTWLDARVDALCAVQAACERIRATPTPFAYSLLLHRTAWLFCLLIPFALTGAIGMAAPLVSAILAYAFFGLDALGDELEEPFVLRANTLPLDALTRMIEIELLDTLGETDLPKPLQPDRYVLS